MFLIPNSIKCQWLVLKFESKVYENGKNRSSNFLNIVHFAYVSFFFLLYVTFYNCVVVVKILLALRWLRTNEVSQGNNLIWYKIYLPMLVIREFLESCS